MLIADDDLLMHDLIRHALLETDFVVTLVENGQAAVQSFIKHPPDLVLIDVEMPILNGFDTCNKMRELDPKASIPIVIITGLDDILSIEKAYHHGADDFITKPIVWPTLGHRLNYIHRGNLASLQVPSNARQEQALFSSISDSMALFNAKLEIIKLYEGVQSYLFADRDLQVKQQGCLIYILQQHLTSKPSQLTSIDNENEFISLIDINEKQYYIECKQGSFGAGELIMVIRDISQRKKH